MLGLEGVIMLFLPKIKRGGGNATIYPSIYLSLYILKASKLL